MINTVLTLPTSSQDPLSIRAKALLFHDHASVQLLKQIERVAPTDATVLLTGETGTGKELIARHMHVLSERKGPFIPVNCGAFSDNLIDAELFGHEAGAYTGALQSRAGWFETANQGTLFLDEIGDLPLHLQVKLLRVLQEQQVVRLGSRKPVSLNVRLIAATNASLERAVKAGKFRADLYYRLHVAFIQVLPLRHRREDIFPLSEHFVQLYSRRLGYGKIYLSENAKKALYDYTWPGNIRELENIIHYALIVSHHGVIEENDLIFTDMLAHSEEITGHQDTQLPSLAETNTYENTVAADGYEKTTEWQNLDTINASITLQKIEALYMILLENPSSHIYHELESTLIKAAYTYCKCNQVRTAKILGISRNTLRTLLRRHNLLAD